MTSASPSPSLTQRLANHSPTITVSLVINFCLALFILEMREAGPFSAARQRFLPLRKLLQFKQQTSSSKLSSLKPPIVYIPRDIQFSAKGHAAYNEALNKHGDVVIIPRHGRMEYVLEHVHVREVLTNTHNYSFDKAVTNMLHMEFMLWFNNGTFISEVDRLVAEGLTPRLSAYVDEIAPIFENGAGDLDGNKLSDTKTEVTDLYHWAHRLLARSMVKLILGDKYLTPANTEDFMATAIAVARLSGVYENTDGWRYLPWLWSLQTTLSAVLFTIVPRYFLSVVPQLWRDRKERLKNIDRPSNAFVPFFDLLAIKYRNSETGELGFLNFLWCTTVCLGLVFASIHQSAVVAVWCIMTLAKQKQQDIYLGELRSEWEENIQIDSNGNQFWTVESLKRLKKLDSFIREVMRSKGDTFTSLRYTTKDVQIGKYLVPKNSLVSPYVKRVHEHPDNYGGADFDGFQWARKDVPAVQGRHDFIAFGLGRWACPGRHLAISEVKLIMINLFRNFDVALRGDEFHVVDPMNTTSVAPEGILEITRRN
ncbi:Cytochrome P450 monooygenase 3 [Hyphodiscus hymeniophilus]|uniref:Cytochrome P450 monooygenase 3 n=1 Tax=Hyphodiscus hymeniophilus TaxID=353542 RepID=A0A9P6SNG3_9HELO|nr:Cytochrome P450 monooygenase 3 [Hyphodiscus hymeniophilus]